jgi:hypothetical protein
LGQDMHCDPGLLGEDREDVRQQPRVFDGGG